MDLIAFCFAFKLAYLPMGHTVLVDLPRVQSIDFSQSLYVDMTTRLYFWDTFFIGGQMVSYCWPDPPGFTPDRMDFYFNCGLDFELCEVGYSHKCIHPVIPDLGAVDFPLFFRHEAAYDEIYIQFEGRVPILRGGNHGLKKTN